MEIKGKITKVRGDGVFVQSDAPIDLEQLRKHVDNGQLKAVVVVQEKDKITDLQRNHFYALMADYTEYTGVPQEHAESYFKYNFMLFKDSEFPSIARNQMTRGTASELLGFVIEFFIQNGIPFRKQQFYLTTDISKMLYALTMKRLCMVCGKEHAQLHHVDAIGMGRDRRQVDHSKHHFMMLCDEHHQEAHTMGYLPFCQKYFVKSVRLSADDLKELNIQGKYEEEKVDD